MRVPVLHRLNRAAKPWRRRLRARWYTARGRREDAVLQLSRIVDGMFRQDEIRLLYRTALQARGPGDVAEIGSWKGRTAVVMGLGLQDGEHGDCRFYAIDHHQGSDGLQERIARDGSTVDAFRRNVRRAGVADQVEELVMTSAEAAHKLAERGVRLRLLFIDGGHDEASVREDIRGFVPLVRSGGLIALHDCEPDGEWPDVWKVYQEELAPRVDEVARSSSLLVTRLKA